MSLITGSIGEFFSLLRIQTGATTAIAPVLGGILAGQESFFAGVMLFVVGLCYHFFGFVLNEYVDVEVDRQSVDLSEKPLVGGYISMHQALGIVVVFLVLGLVVLGVFFQLVLPILLFAAALLFGGLYDFFGKKIVGMDVFLAAGFFCLCLTGASTVSSNFSAVVILVSLVYFVQILFNNSVEGGVKDIDHDGKSGAQTIAQSLGVSIQHAQLQVSFVFLVYSFVLRGFFFGVVFLIGVQIFGDVWRLVDYFVIGIVVVLGAVSLWLVWRFLQGRVFDRSWLKKRFSMHEMLSYFLVIILLSSLMQGLVVIVLLILPAVWYMGFNMVLYGKIFEPNI